jgi:hypothetical protein
VAKNPWRFRPAGGPFFAHFRLPLPLGRRGWFTARQIDFAFKVFSQDYDLPPDLSAVAKDEIGRINIALLNLKAFSMTVQEPDFKIAATQIQDACEQIRIAAKPYAYRSPA